MKPRPRARATEGRASRRRWHDARSRHRETNGVKWSRRPRRSHGLARGGRDVSSRRAGSAPRRSCDRSGRRVLGRHTLQQPGDCSRVVGRHAVAVAGNVQRGRPRALPDGRPPFHGSLSDHDGRPCLWEQQKHGVVHRCAKHAQVDVFCKRLCTRVPHAARAQPRHDAHAAQLGGASCVVVCHISARSNAVTWSESGW
jgi:hypothetical protein